MIVLYLAMKILMIDDDDALVTVFSAAFRNHGHEVITAPNGKSGIEKAKTMAPQIVLLDQVLPDIQGNEVLRMLKEDQATKAIPVAMLSNFGQEELIQNAINGGAVDYFMKYQVEPDYLEGKIKQIVESQQPQTGSEQPF
jgi:DNA-binding response OmpR family regulator